MGKLREQILTETCGACDTDGCGHSKASECPFASNLADRILNLFKSQVEGLTVIGVMEMPPILEKIDLPHNIPNTAENYLYLWTEREVLVKAQLQDCQRQLGGMK